MYKCNNVAAMVRGEIQKKHTKCWPQIVLASFLALEHCLQQVEYLDFGINLHFCTSASRIINQSEHDQSQESVRAVFAAQQHQSINQQSSE